MKHLRNWRAWAIFACVLVVGSLLIVSVGFQQHAPVIPKVAAQMGSGYSAASYNVGTFSMGSGGYSSGLGGFAGDYLFSRGSSLYGQSSMGSAGYSAPPYNVGMLYSSHPSSSMFPGTTISICPDGGGGDGTKMTTLMTCSGCGMTMSTCDWNCGVTFSFCSPGGGSGGTTSVACTGMICGGGGGGTGLICGGVNTMGACTTGTICGGSTLVECSTGMICGGNTLGMCTTGTICGGNTMMACTSMGCGGPGGGTGIVCGVDTLMVSCTETYTACSKETLKGCIGPWPIPGPTAGAYLCGGGPTAGAAYCGGGPTGGTAYCVMPLYQGLSVGTNYNWSSGYQRYRAPGHSPAF